jgi:hypothetical protein
MSSFSQVGALNKNDRLQHEIDCFTKKLEQEKRKLVMFSEEYPKINKVLNEKRKLLTIRKRRSEKANRAAKKSSYSEEQTRYNRRSPDMKLTEINVTKLRNKLQHDNVQCNKELSENIRLKKLIDNERKNRNQ